MSLIQCPDCNNKISSEAKVCIHCGREFKNLRQKLAVRAFWLEVIIRIIGIGFLIIILIGLFLMTKGLK